VIKDLTLIAQTILLHAKRHWLEMISTMLWAMALKVAEERLSMFYRLIWMERHLSDTAEC